MGGGSALGVYVLVSAAAKNYTGPAIVLSALGVGVVSWIVGKAPLTFASIPYITYAKFSTRETTLAFQIFSNFFQIFSNFFQIFSIFFNFFSIFFNFFSNFFQIFFKFFQIFSNFFQIFSNFFLKKKTFKFQISAAKCSKQNNLQGNILLANVWND